MSEYKIRLEASLLRIQTSNIRINLPDIFYA